MKIDDAQQQLFMAIAFSNIEGIEKACTNGADLDGFFEDGETPLTEAILGGMGNYEAVKELIRLGSNPNLKDRNGWTPWNACLSRLQDQVVKEEQEQIYELLEEHGASREGEEIIYLWRYSLDGDIDNVRSLLESGVNPNSNLVCPLSVAVMSGNIELVELLLLKGANVDGNDPKDHENLTPLIFAANDGNLEMAQLLVNYGADIGYEVFEGEEKRTAKVYALDKGHKQLAMWLQEKIEDMA